MENNPPTRAAARRKLSAFTQVSLDGFFADAHGDMSWAHKHDPEWQQFAAENAKGGGALLFGRVTYEQMASFWPSEAARQMNADVAEGMNRMPKYVVSRTMQRAEWANTTVIAGGDEQELAAAVLALKQEEGPDLAIMGSGSIVSQLTAARLIDSYQLVINPLVLGSGRTLFASVTEQVPLKLVQTRSFGNGNVVLWYEPIPAG